MTSSGFKDCYDNIAYSISTCYFFSVENFELSPKEAWFFLALLESNRETALQLLAADHVYEPSLLPRLQKFIRQAKQANYL